MNEIIDFLKNRGVEHLVHFTPISNLENIKKKGIVPRSLLVESGDTNFIALDDMRLDERLNMSCFSFSFPNFMMMYRYRQELQKKSDDVALLFIAIGVLSSFKEDQVLFYPGNAAAREYRDRDVNSFRGLPALEGMFAEELRDEKGRIFRRADSNLPSYLTTNPQAEVQISATIPWTSINFIIVDGHARKSSLRQAGMNKTYAKWQVNNNEKLNVFRFPGYWKVGARTMENENGD